MYDLRERHLGIKYGIIEGNNNIFIFKTGLYGHVNGYHNKYLKMAKEINKEYGFTVIVSSYPDNNADHLTDLMNVIDNYCDKKKFSDCNLYFMGHSKGACLGLEASVKYNKFNKLLLVNTPIDYNIYGVEEMIKNFDGEKLIMVIGEYDYSYCSSFFYNKLQNDKFKMVYIKGADHHFTKHLNEFMELPKLLIK